MNKRILFVEGERDEREEMERSLDSLTRVWDMAFARNGAEALEMMKKTAFDAVVTDIRLRDLSGTDLLNKVGELHPRSLRFIRASFADRSLIMACVWGTHHFIPKPCDGPELVITLRRGLALTDWLSSDNLKGLLSQMGIFPCLPSLYFEVMRRLDSPSVAVESIAAVVGKDLAMTAKLLQMVNSAFFGFQQKITSVHDAITILGMETVKSIILSIHVFSHYENSEHGRFSIDRLWSHSVAVATAAKRITLAQTRDEQMADEAFTAGLLHDIGKMALAANFPEKYNEVMERARSEQVTLPEAEQKLLGTTHCEAGAYLLGLWGMPIGLIEAALFHHRPSISFYHSFSPLTAVHIANFLDHEQHSGTDGFAPTPLDTAYFETLGLDGRIEKWREGATEPALKSAELLPIPKIASARKAPVPVNGRPPRTEAKEPRPFFVDEAPARSGQFVRVLVLTLAISAASVLGFVSWLPITKRPQLSIEVNARNPLSMVANPANSQDVRSTSTTEPSAAVSLAATTPKLSVGEQAVPVGVPPQSLQFPIIRLDDVTWDWLRPAALIDGKILYVGDCIDGAELIEISPSSVTLRFEGETQTFHLP